MSTVIQELNTEMASLVGEVERSLVLVQDDMGGMGGGTIWHPDGLIITNAHVVRRSPLTVTVKDGQTLPARVLVYNASQDLAALAVSASGLPTAKLGESRRLQPGQWVMALGHPGGIGGAATAGVVVGVGPARPDVPTLGRDWVVVDLHLRPGYSGGPLLDVKGRLVGINTMMISPDIGMAVPVHVIKRFLHNAFGSQRVA